MVSRWLDSLVNRAVLLVVAAILLTTVAVTLSNSIASSQELKAQAESQVELIAGLIAGELDQKLRVRLFTLSDIASSLTMSEEAFTSRAQLLVSRQAGLRHLFDSAFLFDAQGQIIATYPEELPLATMDVSSRDFFLQVSTQLTPVISKPFLATVERIPVMVMAAPVLNHQGKVIGVLGGAIRLDGTNFLADLVTTHIGQSGYIGIATRDGTTVAHGGASAMVMQPIPAGNATFEDALSGFEGIRYDRNHQGENVLIAIRQLNEAPWFVAVLWPLKEALMPTYRLGEILIWVMLGVVLVLAPLALVTFRRLMAPMTDLVNQISERHLGVRSQPVRVGGGREIRRVANIFNTVIEERSEVMESLADREAFFRSLSSSSPVGIVQADVLGRIEFVNPAFEQIVGAEASELRHRRLDTLMDPGDRAVATKDWYKARDIGGVFRSRFRIHRQEDNRKVWVDVMSARIDTRDKTLGIITVVRDITHELEVEAALKAEKLRAESILGVLQEGVMLTDARGNVRYANRSARDYLGVDKDVGHCNFFETVTIEADGEFWDQERLLAECEVPVLDAVLRNSDSQQFDVELTMLRLNAGEDTERLVFVVRDDSERRRHEERLSWEASHDSLTGLLNRRAFTSDLVKWLDDAGNLQTPSVLMLIDLDHFKPVNDLGGHLLGDELLRRLAGVLMSSVRQSDLVARLGGDEFAILLPACGMARAETLAEEIRAAIEELSITQDGQEFRVTASIGLTELSSADSGPKETFARADEGCYAAKAQGRNTVVAVPLPPENGD